MSPEMVLDIVKWAVGVLGACLLALASAWLWSAKVMAKGVALLTELKVHVEAMKEHGPKIASHETRLTVHETRLDAHDERIGALEHAHKREFDAE